VRMFALLGDPLIAANVAYRRLVECQTAFLALYRSANFAEALRLDPRAPNYAMWLGSALYSGARADAAARLANRTGTAPDHVTPDETAIDDDRALAAMLLAEQLEPRLAQPHYIAGRIHRAHERARDAAVEFTAAITASPHDGAMYVSLVALYQSWGYLDEAIAVATKGLELGESQLSRSLLSMLLGELYDEQGNLVRALSAYDDAVETNPDNAAVRYERGQARFRHKDYAAAKGDLEWYVQRAHTGEFFNDVANAMLFEIAATKHK